MRGQKTTLIGAYCAPSQILYPLVAARTIVRDATTGLDVSTAQFDHRSVADPALGLTSATYSPFPLYLTDDPSNGIGEKQEKRRAECNRSRAEPRLNCARWKTVYSEVPLACEGRPSLDRTMRLSGLPGEISGGDLQRLMRIAKRRVYWLNWLGSIRTISGFPW